MALKQFKTESKRLLDLMANSIYTNKDIFVRELVSNASDALDKRHYLALTDTDLADDDLHIAITLDKKARLFKISDNGIGMDREDLENNLGTIAKSGSFDFIKELEDKKDVDIIGQFGVGFYSAFMVADRIEVLTKKVKTDKAYRWISESEEGYEIKTAQKDSVGTDIILHLKEDTDEVKYSDYLNSDYIQVLIKKYSDYIRYPIRMDVEVIKTTDEEGKSETRIENKTINSMTPLWRKNKKDITPQEYEDFYMQTFYDFNKPLKTLHYSVEGNTSYTALLFIPSKAPYNYYTTDYKLGLKLYSRGVFIKDEASELVSDCFRFIRGLVDSDDISLNISREILQKDHQMEAIKRSIDKRIKTTLEKMLNEEFDEYTKFFEEFGAQLKFGAYEDYGKNKDMLIDLLIFKSSYKDEYTTLKDYVQRMKEDQKEIYYAVGESITKIKEMPQIERVLDKGYEVLYFLDNVDEFLATILMNYDGHGFKSINKGDVDFESAEEKEKREKETSENKDILEEIKKVLGDKVIDVRLSSRLKSHPVCLVADDNLSLEMERFLNETNQGKGLKANKILEINPDHNLFKSLKKAYDRHDDIDDFASVLYDQALLLAGLEIDDPVAFSKRIADMMIKAIDNE